MFQEAKSFNSAENPTQKKEEEGIEFEKDPPKKDIKNLNV